MPILQLPKLDEDLVKVLVDALAEVGGSGIQTISLRTPFSPKAAARVGDRTPPQVRAETSVLLSETRNSSRQKPSYFTLFIAPMTILAPFPEGRVRPYSGPCSSEPIPGRGRVFTAAWQRAFRTWMKRLSTCCGAWIMKSRRRAGGGDSASKSVVFEQRLKLLFGGDVRNVLRYGLLSGFWESHNCSGFKVLCTMRQDSVYPEPSPLRLSKYVSFSGLIFLHVAHSFQVLRGGTSQLKRAELDGVRECRVRQDGRAGLEILVLGRTLSSPRTSGTCIEAPGARRRADPHAL